MIVIKIWRVRRQSTLLCSHSWAGANKGDTLTDAMRIIVESAAMYTISMFLFFVTLLANNNFQYPASDVVCSCSDYRFDYVPRYSTYSFCSPHSGPSHHCWCLYPFLFHLLLYQLTITRVLGYSIQPNHHPHQNGKIYRNLIHSRCRTRGRADITLP